MQITPPASDWLALSLVSGLGTRTIHNLLEHFPSVAALLDAPVAELQQAGLRREVAQRLPQARQARSFLMESRLLEESERVRLLCPESPEFPAAIKQIHSVPAVLYVDGELPHPEQLCIAFVGSRACTSYGREQTRRLIQELAKLAPECVIVSGLARGIDTVAHQAALEAGLRTVAVLAGGLRHIYPPENTGLAAQIAAQGAVISEFPLATRPAAHNFPIRNRLISGLSQGVVVSEAGVKSGAILTAVFAQQQNREVFALPGRVDVQASGGCNRLIARQQAKLITNAQDILEDLAAFRCPLAGAEQLSLALPPAQTTLRKEEVSEQKWQILESLRSGSAEVDHLHVTTGIELHVLLGLLVEMELEGWLLTQSGESYSLNDGLELQG